MIKNDALLVVFIGVLFSSVIIIFVDNEKIQNTSLLIVNTTISSFFAYKRGD